LLDKVIPFFTSTEKDVKLTIKESKTTAEASKIVEETKSATVISKSTAEDDSKLSPAEHEALYGSDKPDNTINVLMSEDGTNAEEWNLDEMVLFDFDTADFNEDLMADDFNEAAAFLQSSPSPAIKIEEDEESLYRKKAGNDLYVFFHHYQKMMLQREGNVRRLSDHVRKELALKMFESEDYERIHQMVDEFLCEFVNSGGMKMTKDRRMVPLTLLPKQLKRGKRSCSYKKRKDAGQKRGPYKKRQNK